MARELDDVDAALVWEGQMPSHIKSYCHHADLFISDYRSL